MRSKLSFAEDEFGKKLDRCLTDGIVKSSGGLILGSVLSLLFFKRRAWPLLVGMGFGAGMAYRSCEKELNNSHIITNRTLINSANDNK